jgi:hypothetical protein
MSAKTKKQNKNLGNKTAGYFKWYYFSRENIAGGFLILFLICVVFMFVGVKEYGNTLWVKNSSGIVTGVITNKFQDTSESASSLDHVNYSFKLADNKSYTGSDSVSESYYNSISSGSAARIIYNTKNPFKNYINGFQQTKSGALVVIIGCALVAVISLVFFIFMRLGYIRIGFDI